MRVPVIGLLQAAADGREDLPLAVMEEAHVRWAIESGFGPLLWYATHAAAGATASPHWPLVQGTELAARLLMAEQCAAMGEILEACHGRMPPVTLLKRLRSHRPASECRHRLDRGTRRAPAGH